MDDGGLNAGKNPKRVGGWLPRVSAGLTPLKFRSPEEVKNYMVEPDVLVRL
jgi:hypothetical protein